MPAPKSLARLPKPVLFGLYGAIGGLIGALVFAELLYRLLTPAPPPFPAAPEAQVAIVASPDVDLFVEGRNTFPVQIARDGFDGPVIVRLSGLPAGVSADPVTIAAGASEGAVLVTSTSAAKVVASHPVKAVAEADVGSQKITAETPINFKVTDPPRPLADIVFVLDVTNSMQWAIDDLKNGIGKFAESLLKARVDFRLGLVTFQDLSNPGETVEVIQFKGGPFTADPSWFRDEVSKLKASGGGDIPESSLEGVAAACNLPFRKNATKLLLLITDAPPKVAGNTAMAVLQSARRVQDASIDSVHVVGLRFDKDVYAPMLTAGADKAGGKWFDLKEVVSGDDGFDGLLATFGGVVTAAAIAKNPDAKPQVASKIAEVPKLSVKSLQSGEQSAAGTEGRLVLRSGMWTAAIAALVCLFLLGGQHHYLRGTLPPIGGVAGGILGGLAVGLVGGAAGQGLFFLAPESAVLANVFRVFGWALLGGLAGIGLSLFIPNMKWLLGLAGGAIGGAAGALGFIAVSYLTGDLVGRLVGGLVLGFFIGLMVALAESAFRRAWLEVKFSGGETISVNLGPEPVKVGSDAKMCTVWARGAAALALRYFVRDGKVVCDDTVQQRETIVGNGFVREVGTIRLTVHTSSGTAPSAAAELHSKTPVVTTYDDDDDLGPPMPVVSRAPVATPKPIPVRESRPAPSARPSSYDDDDDDLGPPMPKPPAVAKPPAPVKPTAPPKPAAPPRPVSPPPAAAQPAATKADACPGCGRVATGKPGQRYCMICDETY